MHTPRPTQPGCPHGPEKLPGIIGPCRLTTLEKPLGLGWQKGGHARHKLWRRAAFPGLFCPGHRRPPFSGEKESQTEGKEEIIKINVV